MNNLEQKVKAAAIETWQRIGEDLLKQTTHKRISFISECDGVFDVATYDRVTKELEVSYEVGKGEVVSIFPSEASGYFDETEKRTLKFSVA